MATRVNPFNQVYVTETIPPTGFTKLFSPLLVSDTVSLYQQGNIVLTGIQGSGKSMLLSLLKPEIRIAYAEVADVDHPLPPDLRQFLGAGMNLARCGALDFGQRPVESDDTQDATKLPGYFADFVNYWIVRDILVSVDLLAEGADGRIAAELRLDTNAERLDAFAEALSAEDCWSGFLHGVTDYLGLKRRLAARLTAYREFLNYNSDEIPTGIRESRTSIGEPISQTARALSTWGIVPETVPCLIRIDQHEELLHLEDWSEEQGFYRQYRGVVNKLIGTRDPRVSYRIGTRPYAWRSDDDARIYGTKAVVEELRNYKRIDFDEILRRRENRKTWLFPGFAEDVFRRRLQYVGSPTRGGKFNHLRSVFQYCWQGDKKAEIYAGRQPRQVLQCPDDWPRTIRDCLESLALNSPLSAILGEAWTRQQLDRDRPQLPTEGDLPWERKHKRWWKKERIAQALLQMAARKRQRLVWAGARDILTLSGGNVLGFLSICQQVWGAWLRSLPVEESLTGNGKLPEIDDPYVQTEGIEEASRKWYRKIRQDAGDWLQRLARVVGETFRTELREDNRMSYPGHNGFSLAVKELEEAPEVSACLRKAVAYGVLYDSPHTPKSAGSGERHKWYLNPILSPHFQVPAAHTKEPMYIGVGKLRGWLVDAKVLPPNRKVHRHEQGEGAAPGQLSLFDGDKEV